MASNVVGGLGNSGSGGTKGAPDTGGEVPVTQEELDILADVPPVGDEGKKKTADNEVSDDEDDSENLPPAPEKKKESSEDSEDEEEEDEDKDDELQEDESEDEDVEVDEEEEDDERKASEDEVEQPSVNFKAIDKEFPGVFKKHPELRAAVARDFNYRKLLPSLEDAKEAVEKANAIDYLGATVSEGNFEPLLKSLGKEPENLKNFAKSILPTLNKIDPALRSEAIVPAIKTILRNALATGRSTKNDSLANAAQHMAAYLFEQDWRSTFEPPKREEEKKEDPEKLKLQERLQEVESQRERDFITSVKAEAYEELEKESRKIFVKAEKLYPEKKLTTLQKEAIFTRTQNIIGKKLQKNADHQAKMDRLFMEAKKAGYTSDRKPSVKNAYLGRAKNLLSEIQLKLIREELGVSSESDEAPETKTKAGSTKRIPPQPPSKRAKTVEKDPNKAFKNVSEEQFLEM